MKTVKLPIKKKSKVDFELYKESLKLSRKLAKLGLGRGRSYSLPAPYQNRLVKATPAEMLELDSE